MRSLIANSRVFKLLVANIWLQPKPSAHSDTGWYGFGYLFSAELSLKEYWQRPRSQDIREEKDYT